MHGIVGRRALMLGCAATCQVRPAAARLLQTVPPSSGLAGRHSTALTALLIEALYDADAPHMEPYVAALQQSHKSLLRTLVKRAREADRDLIDAMNTDRIIIEALYEAKFGSEESARAHTFSIRPWGEDHVQQA